MNTLSLTDNFISAESILNEVENLLSSYYEKGIVENSFLYAIIRECLAKLGAKIYPTDSKMLVVENYKTALPEDFHKLVYAIGCGNYTDYAPLTEHPQLHEKIIGKWYEKDNFLKLQSDVTMCLDDCGTVYQVYQRHEGFEYTYTDTYPLKITSNNYCTLNCLNKNIASKNEIHIKGGILYTNFSSGSVCITYTQNLITEEGELLIPDYPQITEWIKAACIRGILEKIYYNGEADVLQRLGYAKKEEGIKELNARSFARRSEVSELYNLRKVLYNRYNKFTKVVTG